MRHGNGVNGTLFIAFMLLQLVAICQVTRVLCSQVASSWRQRSDLSLVFESICHLLLLSNLLIPKVEASR